MSDTHSAPPVSLDAEGQELLQQVVDYYHATLKASPEAMDYLKARGIDHPEAIDHFKLGYANRTLGLTLPDKGVKAGAVIRGRLTTLGLYRETGHEHFNGCLVFPVMDSAGKVQGVYGRKLLDVVRKGLPIHLTLTTPPKGVWNEEGIQGASEVILCKSITDALTFWCAGHRAVTAAHGMDGFTKDHLTALLKQGVKRLLIAFDGNEGGDRAARKIAHQLTKHDMECRRILLPHDMDVNRYATTATPTDPSLAQLMELALPINVAGAASSGSSAPKRRYRPLPMQEAPRLRRAVPVPSTPSGSAPPQPSAHPMGLLQQPEPLMVPAEMVSSTPLAQGDDLAHEIHGQDLLLNMMGRSYRVRGWQKALNSQCLKVNLMVSMGDRFHVDSLDMYHAKARAAFIRQAGMELGVSEDALKLETGKVLRKVEALQSVLLAEALRKKDQTPTLTEAEQAEAMALLKAPDLMERVLQDFEALGMVGEESNKLIGYLAAVSRLLDRPLALLIQSASAAGKTSLMDAVLDLMPPEAMVRYSSMSGQSLFYMGDKNLSHKVLAIAEEEGAKQASYALKLLQSEGKVSMASTGKDHATGLLRTHDYEVEGPVMLFLTTTAVDLDDELLNRCMVLTVDESREQTRAIHSRQRSRETLEGVLSKTRRDNLVNLHRNAQRLLQPLAVVNPYADQLSFQDHQTRSRRDHLKYLTLIRSIALLHQFQREVKTIPHNGQPLRYIEVMPADIALANDLAQEVLGRSLDDLLPQTRKLLGLLHGWVRTECQRLGVHQADFRFTRKQLRDAIQWGDTQLKVHLARLCELELLLAHRGRQGRSYAYELVYQGDDADGRARLLGLIDPNLIEAAPVPSRSQADQTQFADCGRGMVGGRSGIGRGVGVSLEASHGGHPSLIQPVEAVKGASGVYIPLTVTYPQIQPLIASEVL